MKLMLLATPSWLVLASWHINTVGITLGLLLPSAPYRHRGEPRRPLKGARYRMPSVDTGSSESGRTRSLSRVCEMRSHSEENRRELGVRTAWHHNWGAYRPSGNARDAEVMPQRPRPLFCPASPWRGLPAQTLAAWMSRDANSAPHGCAPRFPFSNASVR